MDLSNISQKADLLRARALGSNHSFPVNLFTIANYLGFEVYSFVPKDKNENMAGYLKLSENKISLNDNDNKQRKIFTLAHEIGHIELHQDYLKDNDIDIVYREQFNNEQNNKIEREANEFAANLLMPSYVFQWIFKRYNGDIIEVANFFYVSTQAAVVRANKLGLS